MSQGWLTLKRREGEKVVAVLPSGEEIWIALAKHSHLANGVHLSFKADPSIKIFREEIYKKSAEKPIF